VTEVDIPVLIELLGDIRTQIGYGAKGVLIRFGSAAVPALQEAKGSRYGNTASLASDALMFIEINATHLSPEPRP
jgi:hypothetical protein